MTFMPSHKNIVSHWFKDFQPIYFVLALFLFAQTATLIHSEVHSFHQHEAECDIFQGVENQTLDSVIPYSQPTVENSFVSLGLLAISCLSHEAITSKARSPPIS